MKNYLYRYDLPGFGSLAVGAFRGLTNLVEDLHRKIAGIPAGRKTNGIPGLVYGSIRGAAGLASAISSPLARLLPMPAEQGSTPGRETMLAALNGVLGDHLAATKNSLAVPMGFRQNGQTLQLNEQGLAAAFPQPSRKLLVLVHGLCI